MSLGASASTAGRRAPHRQRHGRAKAQIDVAGGPGFVARGTKAFERGIGAPRGASQGMLGDGCPGPRA
eukprot:7845619-Lingulodinium_polyedra.AAC.1